MMELVVQKKGSLLVGQEVGADEPGPFVESAVGAEPHVAERLTPHLFTGAFEHGPDVNVRDLLSISLDGRLKGPAKVLIIVSRVFGQLAAPPGQCFVLS